MTPTFPHGMERKEFLAYLGITVALPALLILALLLSAAPRAALAVGLGSVVVAASELARRRRQETKSPEPPVGA